MKFSFGPSNIPQWKREQFPNQNMMSTPIMKSAMTNTAEMAYQIFTRRESIKYESKTVSDVKSPCFQEFYRYSRIRI
jgi:putative ABC transport system permease protein